MFQIKQYAVDFKRKLQPERENVGENEATI